MTFSDVASPWQPPWQLTWPLPSLRAPLTSPSYDASSYADTSLWHTVWPFAPSDDHTVETDGGKHTHINTCKCLHACIFHSRGILYEHISRKCTHTHTNTHLSVSNCIQWNLLYNMITVSRTWQHYQTVLLLQAAFSVNYRFNIVRNATEHGPVDSSVSILLLYPALSELLPREVLEVSFFSLR